MQTVRLVPLAAALSLALAGSAGAAAEQAKFNGSVPVPAGITVPGCGGESLTFGGTVDVRAHAVEAGNGSFHAQVHARGDGLTATGSTGAKYTFRGEANGELNVKPNVTGEGTLVGNIVAQGSGPNGGDRAHLVAHITVTNNHDVSVAFVKVDVDCK